MFESLFRDMFVLDMPVLEKVLRTVLVYGFLLILLRLAGRRELAQINPFDFVVLLILSNTVQNAIIGNDNSVIGGVIGAIVLIITNQLLVRYFYRHQRTAETLEGDDTMLIRNGAVNKNELRREVITIHELLVAARKQGFDSLDEVDWADLDSSGSFIFKRRKPTADEQNHQALLDRLDMLSQELAELKTELQAKK